MKIRVGILGCAAIAKRSLAPTFLSHDAFELVAVASRSAEKSKMFIADVCSSSRGGIRGCSYDELIQSQDIELIYCPLPTGLHYEWVMKALTAGKHVLCEKSLGRNISEVSDMVETARANHRFLMESFQFRFHPQNLYVRDLLSRNAVGEIRQVVIRFGMPPFPDGKANIRYKKQLGGGALFDNGAYALKASTYLFGADFEVVGASAVVPNGEEVDVYGTANLKSKTGVIVQAAYGFDHFYQNGYEIWGSKGIIKTSRAFTARCGFAAPVIMLNNEGESIRKFDADHFRLLLDYIATTLNHGDFTNEYHECIVQARLVEEVRRIWQ